MENTKYVTGEDIEVLLWLKIMDDTEIEDVYGDIIKSLHEKLIVIDESEFGFKNNRLRTILDRLEEFGLLKDDELTHNGRGLASKILRISNPNIIKKENNIKDYLVRALDNIHIFVKEHKEDIKNILITFAFYMINR